MTAKIAFDFCVVIGTLSFFVIGEWALNYIRSHTGEPKRSE